MHNTRSNHCNKGRNDHVDLDLTRRPGTEGMTIKPGLDVSANRGRHNSIHSFWMLVAHHARYVSFTLRHCTNNNPQCRGLWKHTQLDISKLQTTTTKRAQIHPPSSETTSSSKLDRSRCAVDVWSSGPAQIWEQRLGSPRSAPALMNLGTFVIRSCGCAPDEIRWDYMHQSVRLFLVNRIVAAGAESWCGNTIFRAPQLLIDRLLRQVMRIELIPRWSFHVNFFCAVVDLVDVFHWRVEI